MEWNIHPNVLSLHAPVKHGKWGRARAHARAESSIITHGIQIRWFRIAFESNTAIRIMHTITNPNYGLMNPTLYLHQLTAPKPRGHFYFSRTENSRF